MLRYDVMTIFLEGNLLLLRCVFQILPGFLFLIPLLKGTHHQINLFFYEMNTMRKVVSFHSLQDAKLKSNT